MDLPFHPANTVSQTLTTASCRRPASKSASPGELDFELNVDPQQHIHARTRVVLTNHGLVALAMALLAVCYCVRVIYPQPPRSDIQVTVTCHVQQVLDVPPRVDTAGVAD